MHYIFYNQFTSGHQPKLQEQTTTAIPQFQLYKTKLNQSPIRQDQSIKQPIFRIMHNRKNSCQKSSEQNLKMPLIDLQITSAASEPVVSSSQQIECISKGIPLPKKLFQSWTNRELEQKIEEMKKIMSTYSSQSPVKALQASGKQNKIQELSEDTREDEEKTHTTGNKKIIITIKQQPRKSNTNKINQIWDESTIFETSTHKIQQEKCEIDFIHHIYNSPQIQTKRLFPCIQSSPEKLARKKINNFINGHQRGSSLNPTNKKIEPEIQLNFEKINNEEDKFFQQLFDEFEKRF